MARNIYTVEDFEERLSELTVGTEDVQQLMEFVRSLDSRYKWQARKCDVAATLIGHSTIDECMMEEMYD